ncbi:hypothetical protein ACLKA7_008098 [Drosophila subpalustris]
MLLATSNIIQILSGSILQHQLLPGIQDRYGMRAAHLNVLCTIATFLIANYWENGEETGSCQSLDKVFYGNKISVEVVGKLPAAAPLAQFVVRVCHDVGDAEDNIITDVATIW